MNKLNELYEEAEANTAEYAETTDFYQSLMNAYAKENYEEFNGLMTEHTLGIKTNATASTEELAAQLETFVEDLKAAEANYADYSESQMAQFRDRIVLGAVEALNSLDEEDVQYAQKREQMLADSLEALISAKDVSLEEIVNGYTQMGMTSEEWMKYINDTDNKYLKDIVDSLTEGGTRSAKGFGEGIESGTNETSETVERNLSKTKDTQQRVYEIDSTSRLFERYGKNIVEGLNGGIEEAAPDTNTSLAEWGKIISGWKNGIDLPNIGVDVSYYTPSNAVLNSAIKFLNLPGMPRVRFNKYAEGGMVSEGEFFLARESGPELIGRLGSSTAVMNNNQIVDSVSRGVSNAVKSVISPDMRKRAVSAALRDNPTEIIMQVNESQLGRVTAKAINSVTRHQGKNPLII